MCTSYHYNHNLDPYGEMSRPAVRKVETTEGSRSPSLSWTFLKYHILQVFVTAPLSCGLSSRRWPRWPSPPSAPSPRPRSCPSCSTPPRSACTGCTSDKKNVKNNPDCDRRTPDAERPFDVVGDGPHKLSGTFQGVSVKVLLLVGGHLD